ncbi:ComF family protein, partial [Pseudomonas aeruginosa]
GELDLRSDPHSLRRVLDTPAQQGLDATVRRRNLRHAFALAPARRNRRERHSAVAPVVSTSSTSARCSPRTSLAGA